MSKRTPSPPPSSEEFCESIAASEISRLNRELQRKIREFETLFEVLPVGIGLSYDPECKDIRINPAFAQLLDVNPKDNASLSAPPDERPTNFKCLDKEGNEIPPENLPMQTAAREGSPIKDAEVTIVKENGEKLVLMEQIVPLLDEQGKTFGALGAFWDITAQKKLYFRDRFLVSLDDTIRSLSDAYEITQTYANLLGEHLKVNRCAYAEVLSDQNTFSIIGDYTNGSSSIVGVYKFAHFGDEVLALMRANKAFVCNDVDTCEPKIPDLSAYRATEIQSVICVPLHKEGCLVAAMAVHQTTPREWLEEEVELVQQVANRAWESIQRARIERELRDSEEKFRKIADTLPQIIWVARPNGFRELFNKRWYEFIGYSYQNSEDFGWVDTIHPDDRAMAAEVWQEALRTGNPYYIEYRRRRADGEYRWFLGRGLPLRNNKGEIEKWYGTSTDIHRQKKAEETIDALLAQEKHTRSIAERESLLKDEFLATLSHELRTPLNAILGWSQLLKRPNTSAEHLARGLEVIERNSRAQSQLIDDLLDMNRILSGKLRLDIRQINVFEVVEAALSSVMPSVEAKGIIIGPLPKLRDIQIAGDAGRVQQILWNLLTNAVKFTPRGGRIDIDFERVGANIEISIADTGSGIPEEFLEHVFDRFRQADATTTRRHGGLGLGLAIAKSFTELHGGEIRVRSEGVGKGAVFTVSLPIAQTLAVESHYSSLAAQLSVDLELHSEMPSLEGLEILVVDDEKDSRELVRKILEESHAQVLISGSADEAIEILANQKVDLIISDIGMPGKDGYDFVRHIRALEAQSGIRSGTPAVALTAFARSEDKTKALLAGFQMHLAKPIDPVKLIHVAKNLTKT